jgi:hypothetical protein
MAALRTRNEGTEERRYGQKLDLVGIRVLKVRSFFKSRAILKKCKKKVHAKYFYVMTITDESLYRALTLENYIVKFYSHILQR